MVSDYSYKIYLESTDCMDSCSVIFDCLLFEGMVFYDMPQGNPH